MGANDVDGARKRTGAYGVGGPDGGRGRPAWLIPLLALLALAIVIVVLVLLLSGGDEKKKTSGGSAMMQQATPQSPGGAPSTGSPASGSLTAGGRPVLPLPAAAKLTSFAGKPAAGRSVSVESVIADEAFWVGTGPRDRVLVHLGRSTESPFQVKKGERVTFTGTVKPASAVTAKRFGITDADSVSQLRSQGEYIEVGRGKIKQS